MMTPLEIKGATAAVITSVFILVATFTAGGIYRHTVDGRRILEQASLWKRWAERANFFPSKLCSLPWFGCGWRRGRPSLLKLQISGAHMALVIQSGLKDEMPSFAKKYNEQDTAAIVAYLKTLH